MKPGRSFFCGKFFFQYFYRDLFFNPIFVMDLMAFAREARGIEEGKEQFFSVDLLKNVDNFAWNQVVRSLESDGFVVGAVTENFPTGVFVADGLHEKGQLQGWGLEEEIPEKIVVKNLGWSFRSERPAEPRTDGGLILVPHHVMAISFCRDKQNWEDFMFVPWGKILISVADTAGIQYGQGGFEGCMAMRNDAGKIFGYRLDQNAIRFDKTTKSLALPGFDPVWHEANMRKVVGFNRAYVPKLGEGKLYIRPSVSGLNGGLGVTVPDTSVVTIEVAAFGDYLPESIRIEGRKDIQRPPTGVSKIAPNYGGTFKIKHGVKARGFHDYLSFTEEGMAEEVATCAVGFLDAKGTYVFPPVQDEIDKKKRNILPSITRRSVIEVLKKTGEDVEIRDVDFEEVKKMKGIFTMGNAVGALRVSEICMKENEVDPGELIAFDDKKVVGKIVALREKLYASRMKKLEGFEDWAREI